MQTENYVIKIQHLYAKYMGNWNISYYFKYQIYSTWFNVFKSLSFHFNRKCGWFKQENI